MNCNLCNSILWGKREGASINYGIIYYSFPLENIENIVTPGGGATLTNVKMSGRSNIERSKFLSALNGFWSGFVYVDHYREDLWSVPVDIHRAPGLRVPCAQTLRGFYRLGARQRRYGTIASQPISVSSSHPHKVR